MTTAKAVKQVIGNRKEYILEKVTEENGVQHTHPAKYKEGRQVTTERANLNESDSVDTLTDTEMTEVITKTLDSDIIRNPVKYIAKME